MCVCVCVDHSTAWLWDECMVVSEHLSSCPVCVLHCSDMVTALFGALASELFAPF